METVKIRTPKNSSIRPYGFKLVLIIPLLLGGCTQTKNRDILETFSEEGLKGKWFSIKEYEEVYVPESDDDSYDPKPIKYGDQRLQTAEETITGVYPRPWSKKNVMHWFKNSDNEKHKIALLRILTLTGSDEAAWRNGMILDSEKNTAHRALYISAINNIDRYFTPPGPPQDSARSDHDAAWRWWATNRSKLQKYTED